MYTTYLNKIVNKMSHSNLSSTESDPFISIKVMDTYV